MRRRLTAVLCCVLVVATAVVDHRTVVAAPTAKKTCHTVTKKVHGKKQKVKVCKGVPKPKPTATSTPQQLAQRLAAAITGASSDTARATAIEAAFHAAGIGVYDETTGKAIYKGMEVNAQDYFLLSGEATLLAQAYAAHETFAPLDLAPLFAAVGATTGIENDVPSAMPALVQGVTKWASANPSQPEAFIPLLVRALGQDDSPASDIAQDPSHLDAVQFQLLMVYFGAPFIHMAAGAASTSAVRSHTALGVFCTSVRVALNPLSPNTYLFIADQSGKTQWSTLVDDIGSAYEGWAGQELAKALGVSLDAFGKATDMVNIAGVIAKLVHLLYLNRALHIDTTPDHVATHYGPKGDGDPDPSAGTQVRIQATVTMTQHPPQALQTCLNQAGFTIPSYGPVPNFRVAWRNVTNDLTKYGTITYDPANGHTDQNGVATLVFTPNDETMPGFGTLYRADGEVEPWGAYGLDYGNEPAAIEELFGDILGHVGVEPSLAGDHAGWTVGYHKARGFQFQNLHWHWGDNFGVGYPESTDDVTVSGHICGDDIHGLWTVTIHQVDNWPVFGHFQQDVTYTAPWTPGVGFAVRGTWADATMETALTTGAHPSVNYIASNPSPQADPAHLTVSAPITEDTTDCPENP